MQKLSVLLILFPLLFACKKEHYSTNGAFRLYADSDTLHFDTVFTGRGSVARKVKIFNPNKEGIHINSIKLRGSASSFHINVNGTPGPVVEGIDIAGNDSAYIFVTVSIDTSQTHRPFLERDSIDIVYNNNVLRVQLEAYGQNAHFLHNYSIVTNEVWKNDLPYVISGSLTIQQGAMLVIEKGCHLYMHADAPIIVAGSLRAYGEKEDSSRIVFAGDRLDEPYRNFPAAYPGLIFTDASHDNLLRYTIIKNAYQGVVMNGSSSGTKLNLQQVIIDNAYDAGLLSINSSINAENLLISNCGKNMVLNGGSYQFNHCTFAAYSTHYVQHFYPVMSLSNYVEQNNTFTALSFQALFSNCIFWGESGLINDEVQTTQKGNGNFVANFDHVLWRMQTIPASIHATNSFINVDPQFEMVDFQHQLFSFHLLSSSPAIDKGIASYVNVDVDGNPRPVRAPDLGAYERQ